MGKQWKKDSKAESALKKGKIFTKLAREIYVAAKMGGPDPESNARLNIAVKSALSVSCPKATIERAIAKATGGGDGDQKIEEVVYEGMAPHQVGVLVECQTDNRNRSVSDIRSLFGKNGGNLGDQGSSAWMFDRVCLIEGTKKDVGDPEEEAIEAGANEVFLDEQEEFKYSFYGEPTDLDQIRNVLIERGWDITTAELSFKAKNKADITEEQTAQVVKLLEALDDNDDTHRIYSTID